MLAQAVDTGLNDALMDTMQLCVWGVSIIAVIFAAVKTVAELNKIASARQQDADTRELELAKRTDELAWRENELTWRKSVLAREILEKLESNDKTVQATTMLDWEIASYKMPGGGRKTFSDQQIKLALRVEDLKTLTQDEKYIRECFDALLDGYAHFEHYINRGLIDFEDVRYMHKYWVKTINDDFQLELAAYMSNFEYELAAAFIRRFSGV